jgi:hypothetical protein
MQRRFLLVVLIPKLNTREEGFETFLAWLTTLIDKSQNHGFILLYFSDPPSVRVESTVEELIEGQIQEIKHFLYWIFCILLCVQNLIEQRGLKIKFLMNFDLSI